MANRFVALAVEAHARKRFVRMQRARVVAVDERLLVDVVDDEIERAVAVEIAVRGAAREARRVQPPRFASFTKRQAARRCGTRSSAAASAVIAAISLREVDLATPVRPSPPRIVCAVRRGTRRSPAT